MKLENMFNFEQIAIHEFKANDKFEQKKFKALYSIFVALDVAFGMSYNPKTEVSRFEFPWIENK